MSSHACTRNYANETRTYEREWSAPRAWIPFNLRRLSVCSRVITRNFVRLKVALALRGPLTIHCFRAPEMTIKEPASASTNREPIAPLSPPVQMLHSFTSRRNSFLRPVGVSIPRSRTVFQRHVSLVSPLHGKRTSRRKRTGAFSRALRIYIPRVIGDRARSSACFSLLAERSS